MRIFIILALSLTSAFATAMDRSVLTGAWGIARSNFFSEDDWWLLCVGGDSSGFLSRSLGGSYTRDDFAPDAVILRDGYVEILLSKRSKAVVAAWKASGSGKLTGQWLVYREDGRLYNMMHFPLSLLQDGEPLSDSSAAIRDKSECASILNADLANKMGITH